MSRWRPYWAKKTSRFGSVPTAKTTTRLCTGTSCGQKPEITGGGLPRSACPRKYPRKFFELNRGRANLRWGTSAPTIIIGWTAGGASRTGGRKMIPIWWQITRPGKSGKALVRRQASFRQHSTRPNLCSRKKHRTVLKRQGPSKLSKDRSIIIKISLNRYPGK